jgi:hypothetical protein
MNDDVGRVIFDREWRKRFGCKIKPDKKFQESFSNTITEILDQPWLGNVSIVDIIEALKFKIHTEFNKQEIEMIVNELTLESEGY